MNDIPASTQRWEQITHRRRYRTEVNGLSRDIVYQGRAAVGPDGQTGWYLEGGRDGKGHEFMARRFQDAAEKATHVLTATDMRGTASVNSAVNVGDDTDITLTGTARIPFTVTGKGPFAYKGQMVSPGGGTADLDVLDGRWEVTYVRIDGVVPGKGTGKASRDESIRVPLDYLLEGEEHPDRFAPEWLTAFVTALEARLNGEGGGLT